MALQQDFLDRIVNVHWGKRTQASAGISLAFSADPAFFYLGGEPTIATLFVTNLPELHPNSFKVNLTEGLPIPPFFPAAYYGGTSDLLTMPDGDTATLTGEWNLVQPSSGTAGGQVGYFSQQFKPGKWQPFLGAQTMQLKVVMQLRTLSFVDTGSEDNHYTWNTNADFSPGFISPGIPEFINQAKTGRAESAQTLTFQADFFMGSESSPPTCTLTVSAS